MLERSFRAVSRAWRGAWRGLLAGPWRLTLGRVAIVAAGFGLAALLFVAAGLVPIAASDGHWPATRALLGFAMDRSLSTHTIGVEIPPLDEPGLALKGAGHYATGCMPCHGAPGVARSLIARQMVPEPPYLPEKLGKLEADELFWIVKHGIKYTAMPAWIAQQRDDEVWAMVAFLQRLPELTATQFRQLAYGDSLAAFTDADGARMVMLDAPPLAPLPNCARCHGRNGDGRAAGVFPRLAGQSEVYLLASLRAFAAGERHSGIMQPVAAALNEHQMRALAAHYANLDAVSPLGVDRHDAPPDAARTAAIARGEALAERGRPAERIPSCVECHGPGAQARNPLYPVLAGQYANYLTLQLTLFKLDRRGGTEYAHVMHEVADDLDKRDIRDLAQYYASLPAAPAARPDE